MPLHESLIGLFGGTDPIEEERRRRIAEVNRQVADAKIKHDAVQIERANRIKKVDAQISTHRPAPPVTEREREIRVKAVDKQADNKIITNLREKQAAERNARTAFSNLTEPEIARKFQELSGIFLPQQVNPRDFPNIPKDPTLFQGRTPAELKILDSQFAEAKATGTNEDFVPGPNLKERVKLRLAKNALKEFRTKTARKQSQKDFGGVKPLTEAQVKTLNDAGISTPGEPLPVAVKNFVTVLPQIGIQYQTILAGGQDIDKVGDSIATVLEASGVKNAKKSLEEYRKFQEEKGTAKFVKENLGEPDEVVARNQVAATIGQAAGALVLAPINAPLIGAQTLGRKAALAGIQNAIETLPINLVEAANSGDQSVAERVTTLLFREGIAGGAGAGFAALGKAKGRGIGETDLSIRSGPGAEKVSIKVKGQDLPPPSEGKTTGGYVSEIDGKGFDGKVRVPEGEDHIFLDNINKTDPEGPPVGKDIAKAIAKEMVAAGRVKVKSSITSKTPEKVVAIERQAQVLAAKELGVEVPPMTKNQIEAVQSGLARIAKEKGGNSPEAAKARKLLEEPVAQKGQPTSEGNIDSAIADATGFKPIAGGGQVVRPVRGPDGKLPEKIGNINVKKLDLPDPELQNIQDVQSIHGLDIIMARGKKRPWKVVNADAQKLLNNPTRLKSLLTKPLGEAYTDVELTALREVFTQQSVRLSEATEQLGRLREGTPEYEAQLRQTAEAWGALISLQGRASSGASEAGRSLNILRQMSGGKMAQGLDLPKLANIIRGMDDPEQIGRFARTIKPSLNDKIHELWIMATVSASDAANIGGNTAMGVWNSANRAVEGAIDFVVSAGGARRGREAFVDEAIPFVQMTGARDGIKYAWNHIRTLEAQGPSRVGSKWNHREAIQGKWGDWMRRMSTGRLSAEDEFYGHLGFAGELKSSAMRAAHKEKLTGDAFNNRVSEILNSNLVDPKNKNNWIYKRAMETSLKNTFMQETVLSNLASAGLKSKAGPAVMWGIPFSRVGSAVVTEFAKGSPFGFFYGGYRVAKGDFAGTAFAKPVTGAMVGMTAIWMSKMGLITGSRKPDRSERETLEGVLPSNSIRIGGKWVSLDKFEIPGQILGLYVDSWKALEDGDLDSAEKISEVVKGLTGRMKEGSFANGIGRMFQAFDGDMGQTPEKFTAHMLANFVPRAVARPLAQITGAANTTNKDLGFLQEIEKRVGLNVSGAKQKHGVFGRSLNADKTVMDKLWTAIGIRVQGVKKDPVLTERIRLGVPINRLSTPSSVDAKTGLNEKELFESLPAKDIANYYLSKGGFMRGVDEAVLNHRRYSSLSDDQKATVFRRARSQSARAHDEAWRKADRTFDPSQLSQRVNRISVRRLVVQVMRIQGVTLKPADLERLKSEHEALRLFQ